MRFREADCTLTCARGLQTLRKQMVCLIVCEVVDITFAEPWIGPTLSIPRAPLGLGLSLDFVVLNTIRGSCRSLLEFTVLATITIKSKLKRLVNACSCHEQQVTVTSPTAGGDTTIFIGAELPVLE